MLCTRPGTRAKIAARLARHHELMVALEQEGLSRDDASAEAMRRLLAEENDPKAGAA